MAEASNGSDGDGLGSRVAVLENQLATFGLHYISYRAFIGGCVGVVLTLAGAGYLLISDLRKDIENDLELSLREAVLELTQALDDNIERTNLSMDRHFEELTETHSTILAAVEDANTVVSTGFQHPIATNWPLTDPFFLGSDPGSALLVSDPSLVSDRYSDFIDAITASGGALEIDYGDIQVQIEDGEFVPLFNSDGNVIPLQLPR